MQCVCAFTLHQQEQGSLGEEKTTASKEIIRKNKGVLQ
jgi:hypothetical protein